MQRRQRRLRAGRGHSQGRTHRGDEQRLRRRRTFIPALCRKARHRTVARPVGRRMSSFCPIQRDHLYAGYPQVWPRHGSGLFVSRRPCLPGPRPAGRWRHGAPVARAGAPALRTERGAGRFAGDVPGTRRRVRRVFDRERGGPLRGGNGGRQAARGRADDVPRRASFGCGDRRREAAGRGQLLRRPRSLALARQGADIREGPLCGPL